MAASIPIAALFLFDKAKEASPIRLPTISRMNPAAFMEIAKFMNVGEATT